MPAALLIKVGNTFDGEVVGFGGAAGPDNFAGVGINEIGHLPAGPFDGLLRPPAEEV